MSASFVTRHGEYIDHDHTCQRDALNGPVMCSLKLQYVCRTLLSKRHQRMSLLMVKMDRHRVQLRDTCLMQLSKLQQQPQHPLRYQPWTSKKAHSFSTSSTLCIPVPVSWCLSTTSKVFWCRSGCAWQGDIQSAALLLMLC